MIQPTCTYPTLSESFGLESLPEFAKDLRELYYGFLFQKRFRFDLTSIKLVRPDLSLPTYAGIYPKDGLSPVYNLFDRTGGATNYANRVTRGGCVDFRGKKLSYDEHGGTDFVCPIGTPLVAAAPGHVVMIRTRWLRGGKTVAVDHGSGVITHYTHCSKALVQLGDYVKRGSPVALSGAQGIDLVQFFPLVPPHIHFAVWVHGKLVDPFLAKGEPDHPGTWFYKNNPKPSGPLKNDLIPNLTPVDTKKMNQIVHACQNKRILEHIDNIPDHPAFIAAVLEDALHHEPWAWPVESRRMGVRLDTVQNKASPKIPVKLTLPLPSSKYRGIRLADYPITILILK